jgi:glycosyltransferase A (GT-A) superfamily protein (DUF2064 family)
LSAVKTRLAAGIGGGAAQEFYRLSVQATEALAREFESSAQGIPPPFWALAEAEGPGHPFWAGRRAVWTGKGGLGERLDRMYRLGLGRGSSSMVIGSDSPFLPPGLLGEAARELGRHPERLVIGPSFDGGFYLLGGSVDIPLEAWTSVEYSRTDTLRKLLGALSARGIAWTELPPQGDIDTLEDLVAASGARSGMLPEQERLRQWALEGGAANADAEKEMAS